MEAAATILFVDEQEKSRSTLTEFLSSKGYEVLAAADAGTAMRLLTHTHNPIDVLITHFEIQTMEGWDLARQAKKLLPPLKVLFMADDEPAPQAESEAAPRLFALEQRIEQILQRAAS